MKSVATASSSAQPPAALFAALQRAAVAWRDPTLWRRLQKHGMGRDSSWAEAAGHYAALYEKIAG